MNINIKDIYEKNKGENVEFEGDIKKVYDYKSKEGKFGQKGYQGIIVADDTDEIKVNINIYNEKDIITKDRVGEKVKIKGVTSVWNERTFVFGKIEKTEKDTETEEETEYEENKKIDYDDKTIIEAVKLALEILNKMLWITERNILKDIKNTQEGSELEFEQTEVEPEDIPF